MLIGSDYLQGFTYARHRTKETWCQIARNRRHVLEDGILLKRVKYLCEELECEEYGNNNLLILKPNQAMTISTFEYLFEIIYNMFETFEYL